MENESPFSLLSEAASGNLDSLKTLSAILNAYVAASKPCLYKLKENSNISNAFILSIGTYVYIIYV